MSGKKAERVQPAGSPEPFRAWRASQPPSDNVIEQLRTWAATHPTPKSYWVEHSLDTGERRVARGKRGGPLDRVGKVDSLVRMGALLDCRRRPDFWSILGNYWEICDNVSANIPRLQHLLIKRGCPIREAMTADEYTQYLALPTEVTVWRGCYRRNVDGVSWSLDRNLAAGFPFLSRYRKWDEPPLLIEGTVPKENIAFVKLVRDEQEVVTFPNTSGSGVSRYYRSRAGESMSRTTRLPCDGSTRTPQRISLGEQQPEQP